MNDGPPGPPADADETGAAAPRLVRSSAVVAAGTLASRITGLVRTVVLAGVLGLALLGDSYNLANTTPNLLYDLLVGGVLAATLVPVLVGNLERGDDRGTDAVVSVATVVLAVLSLAAFVAAPAIVGAYAAIGDATGASDVSAADAATRDALAVDLLRMFAPQIFFYGLTTLATALLNTRRRFAAAAFAPVINNVVVIGVLVVVARLATGDLTAAEVLDDTGLRLLLGLGTTAGVALTAVALWPALRAAGVRLRWRLDWRHPAVSMVLRLSGWTLGYVVANQVVLFVVLGLASAEEGGVSAWTYGYQFFQLPYGLFTVSVVTAVLPELSALADRGDRSAFALRFTQGLRLVLLLVLPASAAFLVLAEPLTGLLLAWGAGGGEGAEVAATVGALALGMAGFSTYLYAVRGFYARRDTRTPFWVNLGENVLQVALSLALVAAGAGVAGLAWAFSAAYTVAAVVIVVVLRRRTGPLGGRRALGAIARMAIAAVLSAAAMVAALTLLPDVGDLAQVVVGAAAGVAVYAVAVLALRVPDAREALALVLRRRG